MNKDLGSYLISHSLEGIVLADWEGSIIECNETARRILSYSPSELSEQFIGLIFPPRSVSHLLPNLLHLTRTAGCFEGDIILQDAEGVGIMVRMIAQVWPRDNPSLLIFRFLDWRETHQIMTQLRQSSQMATLGNLTRSLSHEILNPVSVIGGYARRLIGSLGKDSTEGEWAKQVLTGVEKLEAMVETIQTFLNLPDPVFESRSLDALLDESLRKIRKHTENVGIRITEMRSRRFPNIYMDPVLLEKAFAAVMLNSFERMPGGGEITLTREYEEENAVISLRDTGPALDAGQIEEDLSPIHVLGDDRTHLNLAIARRIVEEHGGRLDLSTPESGGLRVKIRLPADRRALRREREM